VLELTSKFSVLETTNSLQLGMRNPMQNGVFTSTLEAMLGIVLGIVSVLALGIILGLALGLEPRIVFLPVLHWK